MYQGFKPISKKNVLRLTKNRLDGGRSETIFLWSPGGPWGPKIGASHFIKHFFVKFPNKKLQNLKMSNRKFLRGVGGKTSKSQGCRGAAIGFYYNFQVGFRSRHFCGGDISLVIC